MPIITRCYADADVIFDAFRVALLRMLPLCLSPLPHIIDDFSLFTLTCFTLFCCCCRLPLLIFSLLSILSYAYIHATDFCRFFDAAAALLRHFAAATAQLLLIFSP